MIRQVPWRPDTCGCTGRFRYNDDDPDGTMAYIPDMVCSIHEGQELDAAWQDNRGRNNAIGELQALKPDLDMASVRSHLNEDRSIDLAVKAGAISEEQRDQAQERIDNRFGAKRVKVEFA